MPTLDQLKPGESGRVLSVDGDGPVVQRIMAMGLLPGCQVTVVRRAPLGDPVFVALHGSRVSLRRAEAAALQIERT